MKQLLQSIVIWTSRYWVVRQIWIGVYSGVEQLASVLLRHAGAIDVYAVRSEPFVITPGLSDIDLLVVLPEKFTHCDASTLRTIWTMLRWVFPILSEAIFLRTTELEEFFLSAADPCMSTKTLHHLGSQQVVALPRVSLSPQEWRLRQLREVYLRTFAHLMPVVMTISTAVHPASYVERERLRQRCRKIAQRIEFTRKLFGFSDDSTFVDTAQELIVMLDRLSRDWLFARNVVCPVSFPGKFPTILTWPSFAAPRVPIMCFIIPPPRSESDLLVLRMQAHPPQPAYVLAITPAIFEASMQLFPFEKWRLQEFGSVHVGEYRPAQSAFSSEFAQQVIREHIAYALSDCTRLELGLPANHSAQALNQMLRLCCEYLRTGDLPAEALGEFRNPGEFDVTPGEIRIKLEEVRELLVRSSVARRVSNGAVRPVRNGERRATNHSNFA